MKKWILLVLLGILLWYLVTSREGVDETLSIRPTCPSGYNMNVINNRCFSDTSVIPSRCPAGQTLDGEVCKGPDNLHSVPNCPEGTYDVKRERKCYSETSPICPTGTLFDSANTGKCVQVILPTCPSGYTMKGIANRCFSDTSVIPSRCPAGQTLDGEVCKGPDNLHSVPNCPEGTYDFTGEKKCYSETSAICPTGTTLDTRLRRCVSQEQSYAEQTGYADLYASVQNPDAGDLAPPIDVSSSTDSDGRRPMNGPVFGSNGPFSGRAGSGQGSAMNAAATLTGSSYAKPIATEGRLDPYDFWPGTKGSKSRGPAPSVPVEGPAWGGFGSSSRSEYSSAPIPADLYGPGSGDNSGFGSGYPQRNSQDTSMIPDYKTTGSDPSNVYAVTSRVPGDQDLFPPGYAQSSSYSLANGSQKTDPVPFLADFSAFQN